VWSKVNDVWSSKRLTLRQEGRCKSSIQRKLALRKAPSVVTPAGNAVSGLSSINKVVRFVRQLIDSGMFIRSVLWERQRSLRPTSLLIPGVISRRPAIATDCNTNPNTFSQFSLLGLTTIAAKGTEGYRLADIRSLQDVASRHRSGGAGY
jgi:hypothetical protein